MEKLIELLKDYIENYGNDAKVREEENYILDTWIEFVYWSRVYLYETIISKKFWFIKWLVENDKIDRWKLWNSETKSSKYSDFELSYDTPREDYTNILLMELAIQDEPIQFLIEMLR